VNIKNVYKKIGYYHVVFLVFLFNLVLIFISPDFLMHLEFKTYDWRMMYTSPNKVSGKVVIAAIDEKSLKELGRWDSWSRNKFPEIIGKIKDYGAKVIAIDVLFSEPSKEDKNLIKYFNNNITIGSFAVNFEETNDKIKIPEDVKNHSYANVLSSRGSVIYSSNSAILPIKDLISSFIGLGHINMLQDSDGVLRRELVGIKLIDEIYPSFAIRTYMLYKDIDIEDVLLIPGKALFLREQKIDLDYDSTFLINYKGREGIFPRYSLSDIYFGRIKLEDVKEKIVLVGATAVGLYDLRVTPLSRNMPGIEKHAHVIENLIDNEFIKKVSNVNLYIVVFLIFCVHVLFTKSLKVRGITIVGFSITIAYILVSFILFKYFKIWINVVFPVLTNLSLFLVVIIYKYAVEESQSRQIKKMFSSYVSDKIVNELIKNPDMAKLGGARKEVTVLFADVRGFTSFTEKHTPEEVVAYLNELLGEMTDIIMKYDGTLDKFVGDEIMAMWNVPVEQEDHAIKAVLCAIEMVKRNRELANRWLKEGKEPLYLGIGINTGEAVVGNMGAEGKKMDYTAIGDSVNLGARIEALTRPLNADILISKITYEKTKSFLKSLDYINIIQCESQHVKGKKEEIIVYKIEVK